MRKEGKSEKKGCMRKKGQTWRQRFDLQKTYLTQVDGEEMYEQKLKKCMRK